MSSKKRKRIRKHLSSPPDTFTQPHPHTTLFMFSLAKRFVHSLEQSAEQFNLLAGSTGQDQYFESANGINSGLRVVQCEKDGIAARYGFEAWFDYILKVNDYDVSLLISDQSEASTEDLVGRIEFERFLEFLSHSIKNDKPIEFVIWSAKGGISRKVNIPASEFAEMSDSVALEDIPLREDDGKNSVQNEKFPKLGVSLQFTPLKAASFVWHVIQVAGNSPASKAGLIPTSDYVIGAQDGLLATGGEDLFSRVIASVYNRKENEPVVIYVYSHDFDVVRPVTILPNRGWGGDGLLGCDVAYGFLHRIPEVLGKFKDEKVDLAPGKPIFTSDSVPSDSVPSDSVPSG